MKINYDREVDIMMIELSDVDYAEETHFSKDRACADRDSRCK